MKTFKDFLFEKEQKALSIEQLADVCRKIVKEISDKVDIPLGLMQQGIVMMEKPYPHIHCQPQLIKDGLEKNDQFLTDEVCGSFSKIAEEYGLDVHTVKKGEEHGEPGDLLAKVEIQRN